MVVNHCRPIRAGCASLQEGGGGGSANDGCSAKGSEADAAHSVGSRDDGDGGGDEDEDFTPAVGTWQPGVWAGGLWGAERGVNVIVIRASDLRVVFDKTWDTSGGRRVADAKAAAASLRDTFAVGGDLGTEGPLRWRWGAHFLVLTTVGAWGGPEEAGLADAVEFAMGSLGGGPTTVAAARGALANPDKPCGFSAVRRCRFTSG